MQSGHGIPQSSLAQFTHMISLVVICMTCFLQTSVTAKPGDDSRTDEQKIEFFENRIRPVLVRTCYECHNSHDLAEGGFAADSREALSKGGQSGQIVVPGDAAGSRLIAILRHEVDGLRMPQGGPKLDESVISDFVQWINDGAIDPRDAPPSADELSKLTSWEAVFEERQQWWSFQPIQQVTPPVTTGRHQPSAIDAFVLAAQEPHGLTMSPKASPETLVRRLYLVLTGLPPRPAELELWSSRLRTELESQPLSRTAVSELVDQLLSSPQFGERWARHWMDWIRYADSHGSEGDPVLDGAWQYRDYLIRALNNDVPANQLIKEHIAGDLLPEGRINADLGINESMIGPAHWRMVFHGFAPTDALEERMRFTDDEINAFSKAFLGITLSCARCHDHKFDAISQKDYYAVYGILDSCRPGRNIIDTRERLNTNRQELIEARDKIRERLASLWLTSSEVLAMNLREMRLAESSGPESASVLRDFRAMQAENPSSSDFANWCVQRTSMPGPLHGRILFDVDHPVMSRQWFSNPTGFSEVVDRGTFVLSLQEQIAVDRVLPPGFFSHLQSTKDPARLTSPDIQLDKDYELWVEAIGDGGAMLRYVVQNYPRNGTVYPVTRLTPEWTWHRFDLSYWKGDSIHVELTTGRDAPLLVDGAERSWFGLRRAILVPRGEQTPKTEPRSDLAVLDQSIRHKPPGSKEEFAERFVQVLSESIQAFGKGEATADQSVFLQACLKEQLLPNVVSQSPELQELLGRWRHLEAGIVVPARVPGIEETRGADRPLFVRGNHKQPADLVPRRFLEAIDSQPYATEQSGRLELAQDIVSAKNPFTRRVLVNRIWHHAFGRGIVRTPDNFGRLGQTPTHPELLDWLAEDFSANNWSIKSLLRKIVTSEVWLQDSQPSDDAKERDPDNLYLSHYPLRRLEGEAIRDSLLFVSGTLDSTMYGPPAAGTSGRRGVYVEVRRNSLDPFLRAFDFPEPFSATGRRDETNVPAQSLTLMNDPGIRRLAESLAASLLSEPRPASDAERIESLYLRMLCRKPTGPEVTAASAHLNETRLFMQQLVSERRRLEILRQAIATDLQTLIEPLRTQLLAQKKSSKIKQPSDVPQPVARWTFDDDANDIHRRLNLQLTGGSRIESGALILQDSLAHAVSPPLPFSLKEKSLEAWVVLQDLDQQGGGVITVQTSDGTYFDSLVIGEQQPRHWLAGSNFFERTRPFGGAAEESAHQVPVHLVLVYSASGEIRAYRNGQLYGSPYQSTGPKEFSAGNSVVSLGLRHLPAGGNRMLKGKILDAAIYDKALTAEQVEAVARRSTEFVSSSEIVDAMTPENRAIYEVLLARQAENQTRLGELASVPKEVTDADIWADLVHSLFCMKEFVYLR